MAKTGQTFVMNTETFTLQNVFAMELHRYQETIGDIVNCAVKELAIEKVKTGEARFFLSDSNCGTRFCTAPPHLHFFVADLHERNNHDAFSSTMLRA